MIKQILRRSRQQQQLFGFSSSLKRDKDKLLRKLRRAVPKAKEELPEEIYTNPEVNAYLLNEKLNQEETLKIYEEFQGPEQNRYVQLLSYMEEAKEEEKQERLPKSTLDEAVTDFVKEQEDALAVEKAGFASDILDKESEEDQNKEKVSIKFLRPPKSSREAVRTLQEADRRYEAKKASLMGRVAAGQQRMNKAEHKEGDYMRNVPKGVSLARLAHPPSNSEIILCGVRRRALLHSSYVNDLLFDLQPECTFLPLSPDLPLFIRPEGDQAKDFRGEWYQFVRRGKNSQFFVNPLPEYPRDVVLTKTRINHLFDGSLKYAVGDIEIGPQAIYSSDTRFEHLASAQDLISPDSFLTPLLYPYNSLASAEDNPRLAVIGDMPLLVQKELQARALSIDQCKHIFNETIEQWSGENNLLYSPQLKYKEVFLLPRINYMTELLRQLSYSYKRIVAVVDCEHVPYFEDAWRHMPREPRPLSSLLNVSESWIQKDAKPNKKDPLNQDTFIEFVEKLAIFDVLLDPFLQENFIKLKSFPFSHQGFLGHETAVLNVLTFWKHYRMKYAQMLSQVPILEEELHAYQKEMGYRYEDDKYSENASARSGEDAHGMTKADKARLTGDLDNPYLFGDHSDAEYGA